MVEEKIFTLSWDNCDLILESGDRCKRYHKCGISVMYFQFRRFYHYSLLLRCLLDHMDRESWLADPVIYKHWILASRNWTIGQ